MSKKIKMTMEDIEAMIDAKVEQRLQAQEEDEIEVEVEETVEEKTPEVDNSELEALKEELAKAKEQNAKWEQLWNTNEEKKIPKLNTRPGWNKPEEK